MRSARPSTACQCSASLFSGLTLMRCAVFCSNSLDMIFVGALAHLAERRRIGHAVVHVQRQQAANLRRFLMASQLFGDKGLFLAPVRLSSSSFFSVEGHRVDQVVGELPVTYPGIAQQVELVCSAFRWRRSWTV